ncbi:MAG: insulinase family protein [Bacilli bacterium]|nr:insulinase family protein [Bacilli bacterium]
MSRVKSVILDNGIRLFVHGDKTMKKCSVSFTVDYGHKGEYYKFNYKGKDYEVLPGCAHFLEHMLLEQSRYGNLYSYFKELNYNANACTSLDYTKYYFTGIKRIKSSIYKLIDAIENPIFDSKAVRKSSPAIEEETKIFDNNAELQAILLSLRNSYSSFDYQHEVSLNPIGNEETTKSLDYDTLKLCYDAFYSDDRKIITIVGPIDEDDMINYIKNIYKKIPNHKNETKLKIPTDLVSIRKKEDVLAKKIVESDLLIINYKQFIKGYSIFEIRSFLNFISEYKFSNKTKFYEKEKNEGTLLFYYGNDIFNIFTNDLDDAFIMQFGFYTANKDKMLNDFEKEFKINNFEERDFELYKKAWISRVLIADEDKYNFYSGLPINIIFYREYIDFVDCIKKLSYDRFIEFYNSLKLDNRVITLLTKEG